MSHRSWLFAMPAFACIASLAPAHLAAQTQPAKKWTQPRTLDGKIVDALLPIFYNLYAQRSSMSAEICIHDSANHWANEKWAKANWKVAESDLYGVVVVCRRELLRETSDNDHKSSVYEAAKEKQQE